MKTNTLKRNILAALLVSTTLVVSGCNHASTPTPVAKTQTKLKHSFGSDQIAAAITNAAQENGWQVVQASSDANSLLLKKTFSKKETAKNTRGRIWNKVRVDQDIYANVAIADNSYEIDLTKESKTFFSNYNATKQLEQAMHKLENSISVELVHDIL
jgi:hypothetical protein